MNACATLRFVTPPPPQYRKRLSAHPSPPLPLTPALRRTRERSTSALLSFCIRVTSSGGIAVVAHEAALLSGVVFRVNEGPANVLDASAGLAFEALFPFVAVAALGITVPVVSAATFATAVSNSVDDRFSRRRCSIPLKRSGDLPVAENANLFVG